MGMTDCLSFRWEKKGLVLDFLFFLAPATGNGRARYRLVFAYTTKKTSEETWLLLSYVAASFAHAQQDLTQLEALFSKCADREPGSVCHSIWAIDPCICGGRVANAERTCNIRPLDPRYPILSACLSAVHAEIGSTILVY